MNAQQRIELLVQLGEYMMSNDEEWQLVKEKAYRENQWFIPEFINLAVKNIAEKFLQKDALTSWMQQYNVPETQQSPKTVGVVMAGNIPLVGFHDFLCVFLSGHIVVIKPSSKDEVLIRHLIKKLYEWEITVQSYVSFATTLKGCDAYIATGSNNSGRYFEYYFSKYPNIIRKNRTSVAVLDGTETKPELEKLAEDIQVYFGLGCRNVTKLFVPQQYDFMQLLDALKKYSSFTEFHKYKHNYDYQLAILIMNGKFYMNSGAVIVTESDSSFAPVSQVFYEYYDDEQTLLQKLADNKDIQCIVGHNHTAFGEAQQPDLNDYADGVDTMQFLMQL